MSTITASLLTKLLKAPALTRFCFLFAAICRRGRVKLPPGDFKLTESIKIPTNGFLEGSGYGTNFICTGNFPAIVFENADGSRVTNAKASNFRITRTNTLGSVVVLQSLSDGIVLWGDKLEVSDVWIEDCFVAVKTAYQTDPTDYSTDIRLERVISSHSNTLVYTAQYGLLIYSTVGFTALDCEWKNAWLDGIKLARNARDIKIKGGRSSYNGGPGHAGDGIDCFAGGQDVILDGVTFSSNDGNGIVIKTVGDSVTLGNDFNPGWGWMRNFVINGCTCRDNDGNGVAIEAIYNFGSTQTGTKLTDAGENDRPRASHIKITDTICENNTLQGISINGFDVSVKGCTLRANLREGIRVMENARDVFITDTSILGCGMVSAGTKPAITVEGLAERVTITGVSMNGKDHGDEVEIVDDSSYAALTTYHRNGIEIYYGATDIFVNKCFNKYVTSDPYEAVAVCITSVNWTTERVVIEHTGSQTVATLRYTGGPGSTYRSLAQGGTNTTLYLKETGDPDENTGWVAMGVHG